MRLSAKAITTYNGINSFRFDSQWTIRSGEPNTLYFVLTDLDQDELRYITGVGVTNQPVVVQVTFPSINDDLVITKTATLVDAADGSLFKIELLSTDKPSSGNVKFSVQEGTVTRRFSVLAMVGVESDGSGDCC